MRLLIDILYGFGISCGILFAYFRMLDAGQTVKKNEETKLNFFFTWRKIENSKIKALPNIVISFYLTLWLKIKIVFLKIRLNKYVNIFAKNRWTFLVIYIPMLFFTFMRFNPETNIYLFLSQYLIMFLLCLLIAIVYTDLDKVSMLATIFSLSIFISYCAMWIGKLNEYFINPNVAFIIAGTNFIFDTLTIFTTYGILKYLYYIEKKGFIFYFSFVFLDILVASFLSIFVLIVINLFLDLGYTFSNIINVFLGYSVVDSNRDLGGWFWLMHTTFLPTFFYLSLYLLTLFGKAIIIPIGKKIGKASVVDRPHYYTATMFGFIGLVVLAIARVTKWITEMSTY